MKNEGRKDDEGKCRMDLIPPEAIEALGWVLTHGAEQYGERNCEQEMRWGRLYAALLRHMLAWWGGEDADPDSGSSHLNHALFCVSLLVTYEQREIGEDDRPTIDSRTIPERVRDFVAQQDQRQIKPTGVASDSAINEETRIGSRCRTDLHKTILRYFRRKDDWDCQPAMPLKSQRDEVEISKTSYVKAMNELRQAAGLPAVDEAKDKKSGMTLSQFSSADVVEYGIDCSQDEQIFGFCSRCGKWADLNEHRCKDEDEVEKAGE